MAGTLAATNSTGVIGAAFGWQDATAAMSLSVPE
jgi:hypothetical protein